MRLQHSSLSDTTFPNHQINQYGDEAHGDEGQGDHQSVRGVHELRILLRAVVEVERVNGEEEGLGDGVRAVTANVM